MCPREECQQHLHVACATSSQAAVGESWLEECVSLVNQPPGKPSLHFRTFQSYKTPNSVDSNQPLASVRSMRYATHIVCARANTHTHTRMHELWGSPLAVCFCRLLTVVTVSGLSQPGDPFLRHSVKRRMLVGLFAL